MGKRVPLKEVDVARPVVAWLRDQGWTVYQEVKGINADIVATLGKRVWIIEAKRFLNWKLIRQATYRIGLANWVSIVVPPRAFCSDAGIVLRHWGIGCLEAEEYSGQFCVVERLKPRVGKQTVPQFVWDQLSERQQTYCEAGSPGGKAWSPFKQTCEMLRTVVDRTPGISLKDAISQIEHHYASSSSAKQSLSHWIQAGKIRGIRADRGRCITLWPDAQ